MEVTVHSVVLLGVTLCVTAVRSDIEFTDTQERNDYSEIVNTTTFIDKSLLIETLFTNGTGVVTAPIGFGKSTNLDMVKRFLEITIDENGEPQEINTTDNYKLFMDNNLKISKKENFVKEHFGKHPVVYIDFSELCNVTNMVNMLQRFREILMKTFEQHVYLTNSTDFYTQKGAERLLNYYNNTKKYNKQPIQTIWNGFKTLTMFLHDHFGKKSIVLVDNYNNFLEILYTTKNKHKKRIISFINEVNRSLFRKNEYLDRALVMGLPLEKWKIGLKTKYLKKYKFLQDHALWRYFGVTEDELDDMLLRLMKKQRREHIKTVLENERQKLERHLFDLKYVKTTSNITVYSFSTTSNVIRNITRYYEVLN